MWVPSLSQREMLVLFLGECLSYKLAYHVLSAGAVVLSALRSPQCPHLSQRAVPGELGPAE